jgi:hypothetical protein
VSLGTRRQACRTVVDVVGALRGNDGADLLEYMPDIISGKVMVTGEVTDQSTKVLGQRVPVCVSKVPQEMTSEFRIGAAQHRVAGSP